MKITELYSPAELSDLAKRRFAEERGQKQLTGWFLAREIAMECDRTFAAESDAIRIAKTNIEILRRIPLTLGEYHVIAGTMDDAFARSYALINPSFTVKDFEGYCDPAAVFNDIEPTSDITRERIDGVRAYYAQSEYSRALMEAYAPTEKYTGEAVFFIEQVTGHVIPDLRRYLKDGALAVRAELEARRDAAEDPEKKAYFEAMALSVDAMLVLTERYRAIAAEKEKSSEGKTKERFGIIRETLSRVPAYGARNLHEAIQSFALIWQTMCMEQCPNPYAISVGNADRIFEPYRAMEDTDRENAAALLKQLLVFFNVADRSWAISQNLLIGGRDAEGRDLTNPTSYALLDAYFEMNLPQPILSVKLHRNTPERLYREMGRFFFTPGVLTPSVFNEDSLYAILEKHGVEKCDIVDSAVAGCQEPLIMGKENGNTTNSWLNLPKVLELVLQGGCSEITGKQIGKTYAELGYDSALSLLKNLRSVFYKELDFYVDEMVKAANGASTALSLYQVPFLSTMMGGINSGVDMRSAKAMGTRYNGSGCLIHGLSVLADSFVAVDTLVDERPEDAERLLEALRTNFEQDDELRQYLLECDKYGNNIPRVDAEAADIAAKVAELVYSKKNYLGQHFKPDYATPSTHLMYGYWVGATPDGRAAREELNYGVDPLFGDASGGLGMRMLSNAKLPFEKMVGGVASHFGLNPGYFKGETLEEKGVEFKRKVIEPLFFNPATEGRVAPFYLYVNVTTPEMLRKVLENPKKYAPSGVYIVRIHGTFVNFLDLSPEIQEDIIKRLDPNSTAM